MSGTRVKILTNGATALNVRVATSLTAQGRRPPIQPTLALLSCVINVIEFFRDPYVEQLQRYQTKRGVTVHREAGSRCQGPKRQT